MRKASPAGSTLRMPKPKPSSGPMRFGSAPQPKPTVRLPKLASAGVEGMTLPFTPCVTAFSLNHSFTSLSTVQLFVALSQSGAKSAAVRGSESW